jgi:hypothetical protein
MLARCGVQVLTAANGNLPVLMPTSEGGGMVAEKDRS